MNQNTGSLDLIKRINRKLVLERIKTKQPISRAQLAKELSLSKTTVSAIVDELLEKKMITDLGERVPLKGSGRPSKMLGFNPKSAYLMGIDMTTKDSVVLLTDLNGEILYHACGEAITTARGLVLVAVDALKKFGITQERVVGLGISIPGSVSPKGIVMRANAFGWLEYDLKKELKPYFSFPVFVNNEANCAALGERWRGAGEKADDLFYLAVGPGVGSAILCHGNLIYGHTCRAGEVGYCMDRVEYEKGMRNILGTPGVLEEDIDAFLEDKERWQRVLLEYQYGDAAAKETVRQFLTPLALLIGNVVNLVNPQTVLVGGRNAAAVEPLLSDLREMVMQVTPIPTNIAMATLGREAPALGAAAEALECIQQLGKIGE